MAQRGGAGIIVLSVVALVFGGLIALGLIGISNLDQRADEAEQAATERLEQTAERVAASRAERERLADDIDALRDQLMDEGIDPTAPPAGPDPIPEDESEPVVIQGPPGPMGPRGFRGFEGESIEGPMGPEGPPGESIVGPQGDPGPQGESIVGPQGEPGPQGVQGPPGADSTVPGPQGEPGADGQDGADGRGIVSITLESSDLRECELVVTYTDDTEDRFELSPLVCLRT